MFKENITNEQKVLGLKEAIGLVKTNQAIHKQWERAVASLKKDPAIYISDKCLETLIDVVGVEFSLKLDEVEIAFNRYGIEDANEFCKLWGDMADKPKPKKKKVYSVTNEEKINEAFREGWEMLAEDGRDIQQTHKQSMWIKNALTEHDKPK